MIQFKSKHPYSNKYDRWYPMISIKTYKDLNFEDYMYIIGDKVCKEPSQEAEEAFNRAKMWAELKL